jgi:tetratricopeptide (TPR) repeat protein
VTEGKGEQSILRQICNKLLKILFDDGLSMSRLRKILHQRSLALNTLCVAIFLLLCFGNIHNAGYRNWIFINLLMLQDESSKDNLSRELLDKFTDGHTKFPNDFRMLFALSLIFQFQDETAVARSTMETYLEAVPGDTVGRFIIGTIAYESGDYAGALQYWSALGNGSPFILKASEEISAGNLEVAHHLLNAAMETDISSFGVAYRLAEQYALLANELFVRGANENTDLLCSNGSAAFQSAIRAEPTLEFVRINYGSFLRRCQQYPEAIGQFLSVVDADSNYMRAWANHEVALTYAMMLSHEQAITHFEQAVKDDPHNGLYRLSLGRAYVVLSRTEDAREQFLKILNSSDQQWKPVAEELLDRLK